MRLEWLVLVVVLLMISADHLVLWQAYKRQAAVDATKARHALWWRGALLMWAAAALVLWFWIGSGVSLSSVGFGLPEGWRQWAPLALGGVFVGIQASSALKIARLPAPSEKLRAQLAATGGARDIMPRTASELAAFFGVSLTAGFCEELLFRGFLIWVLQPLMGSWLAAAVSTVLFGVAHAYQGVAGMVRTGVIGLVFLAVVLVSHSLWPAIVLHAAVDAMGGIVCWLILREPAPTRAVEAAAP